MDAYDDRRARTARRFIRDHGTGVGDLGLRPGATYLVTGCAGFIGSHLVEALNARRCAVIGVDGFIDTYSRATKELNLKQCAGRDLRFFELNLAEAPVEPLLDGVDGVFHLAARPGVRTSWGSSFGAYTRDNLLVTQRVFEAAVKRNLRVVYASSSSVYGNAESYPVREGGGQPNQRACSQKDQKQHLGVLADHTFLSFPEHAGPVHFRARNRANRPATIARRRAAIV